MFTAPPSLRRAPVERSLRSVLAPRSKRGGGVSGFRQAARRFTAEVEQALTRARRAAGEAAAVAADFRRRNEELSGQAKSGKLRGLRRGEVAPTSQQARADAVRFRTDNGLPVADLPTAEQLMARLPNREPAPPPRTENDDFSQPQVLFDVAGEMPGQSREQQPEISAPDRKATRPSDTEDDFSQQRILMDATVETYRPDGMPGAGGEWGDEETRR
jgi:hypothetical protein